MATAALDAAAAPPAAKGKKKLIIIVVALLLVLALAAAGALLLMKKNAAAQAEDEDEDAPVAAAVASKATGAPPTYVALDPFTVNLADKDSERFAQIAVTLEVDDPKFADQMKAYMPAIRNSILMILAHKTSTELLERAGKVALASEIMREAVRPMGIDIEPEQVQDEVAEPNKKRKKKQRAEVHNPVTNVLFANFIVQ
jgi:flagellar FliL protein